ncbi:unnamed protein product [Enterobius vermicularis]|uniref:Tudor domain-containing protein n=1 Tax=Enterobius vermicularis TaxID=51028 RepID=A0A0N4V6J0_ENTVE|nr:unnamed protein product [Enterobius vermicularis]
MFAFRDRPESPIFTKKQTKKKVEFEMLPNGDRGNGVYKIHRIMPTRTMTCFVSHVTSPSCLWLKPFNHITDQLKVTDLSSLERSPLFTLHRYVLAPISEGVYARARIVAKKEFTEPGNERPTSFSRVLFIDEGYCRWLGDSCLAKMDEAFSFYPYQAVATALFRISPKSGKWASEDTSRLRSILKEYEMFEAKVVIRKDPIEDYRDLLRVELFGKTDNEKCNRICVVSDFFRQGMPYYDYDRNIYDARQQKLYESYDFIYSNMSIWEKNFPVMNDIEDDLEDGEVEDGWSRGAIGNEISVATKEYLRNEGYMNGGKLYVNVEGAHTQSPYEFYARFLRQKPLKAGKKGSEGVSGVGAAGRKSSIVFTEEYVVKNGMIEADSLLRKLAEKLNNFYGLSSNRRLISFEKVKEALCANRSVYGVVEVFSDLARFTGFWQRVEEDNHGHYARVRYVDAGGTAIVLLSSVLELHRKFFDPPPLCFQMCINDIIPRDDDEWSARAKKVFKYYLRDDVPIALNVLDFGRGSSVKRRISSSPVSSGYDCKPHLRPGIVLVNELKVMDGVSNFVVEEYMVQDSLAIWGNVFQ